MLEFLKELVVSEKTKSGEDLLIMMQNPEAKAYLLFLEYILEYFNYFNLFFPSEKTRIHLLQNTAKTLLYNILGHFLKPQVLKHMDLVKLIDFSKGNNQIALNCIHLGPECDIFLSQLLAEGKPDVVQTVRENCIKFYITAANEIRKRFPIDDEFLSKLCVFEPHLALVDNDRDTSFKSVLFIAKKLGGFDEDGLQKEWSTLHLNFADEDKQKLCTLAFDEVWKTVLLTRNDQGSFKYPCLQELLNSIRSLSNSNADAERLLSMLPDIKTKKRNRLCSNNVNAICVTKSTLKADGETARTMEVDDKHLSLMSSKTLYPIFAKKQKSSLPLHAIVGLADFSSTSSNANS